MKFKLLRVILFTLYFVSNRFVFSQSNEIQSNSNSISNYIRFENGKELSIEEFNTWYKEKNC